MNEKEIFAQAEEWLKNKLEIVIITVIDTWGSSPRPIGSSMIVNSRNDIVGSVSGGCIENFVFAKSLDIIKSGKYKILEFGVTNSQAWEVGLTCGGKIKVLLEKFSYTDLKTIKKINKVFNDEGKLIILTDLSNGKREIIESKPINNNFFSKIFANETSKINIFNNNNFFCKVFSSQYKLIIIGAVHISESLVKLANILNFKVFLIDPRNNFNKSNFKNIAQLLTEWPDEGLKKININDKTCIVTLTHDPKLDDPAIIYSLKSDPLYIGCLGSVRTHDARIKRLTKKGFTKKDLSRINGPIGLDINAKTPAEIACAIIAQIISKKNNNAI